MANENSNELLADGAWLRANSTAVVLIDTRPPADFWNGHLPGARHFDPFPFHHSDTGESGLREFRGQLEWIFSALGLTGDETVVCYEDTSGMRATRVAWMLLYMGHPRVRVLDGGLKAAQNLPNDLPLVTTVTPFAPANFKGNPSESEFASFTFIRERIGAPGVQIFDVRTDGEYFGERLRARHAGAIPGAIHRDWVHNLASDGRFKPADQLRREFESLGLRPENEIIPYCQGGYRSANAYIALRLAGYTRVRNYLGSWGEWGNHDDLPIDHPRRKTAA
jgi:thiosulfate/3-mercaptopyruvate sulfurtransferase